jgi:hypothetical protein
MKKMIAVLFAFITVVSVYAQQLGRPTELQDLLNDLPAIQIAGKNLKFTFGGTTWIAKVNGENFMAGTVETVDVSDGSVMALKQTHIWGAAATKAATGKLGGVLGTVGKAVNTAASTWIATPGPEIYLDFNNAESGAKFQVASNDRIAEARAAGLH